MAEFVQQSIEQMLPELEQMERVELFKAKETRVILKKRKVFEYKLRRRMKQKEDFLQYIQYESNLLALLKKRRAALHYNFKQVEIEGAIIYRIHKLFKLACTRFKEDVRLWQSHIEFCKRRRDKGPVSTLFTQMLQIHNKKPGLWILAAKWEMEDGRSMENGRGLLQRGLRFNPTSQLMWQEYFRMELLNSEMLRKRRSALGLSQMKADEEFEVSDAVLEGRAAGIILHKALETLPDDVEFLLSFLPICRLFSFTQSIEDDIFSSLQTLHLDSELTWEAVALRALKRRPLQDFTSLSRKKQDKELNRLEDEAFEIFEKATNKVLTEKMWSLFIKFCVDSLSEERSKKLSSKRLERTLTVFQAAHEANRMSADSYKSWVEVLCNSGQEALAVEDILAEGVRRYPKDVGLWGVRLDITMTTATDPADVQQVFQDALTAVKSKDSCPLWQKVLEWSVLKCPDHTENILEKGLESCSEVCDLMKTAYLEWAIITKDIHHVRKIYNRLCESRPLSIEFFRKYIEIENAQPHCKLKLIRQAYETALREFGTTSTDLWLELVKLEMTHPKGSAENAGSLHWRAKKTLEANLTEMFLTQYTLMQTEQL